MQLCRMCKPCQLWLSKYHTKLMSIMLCFLLLPLILIAGEYSKLTGRVVDAQTNKPVIHADICVIGKGLGAITNENGEYTVCYMSVGTYAVSATHQDYISETDSNIVLKPNDSTILNFQLDFVGSLTFFGGYISKHVPADSMSLFNDSLIAIYDLILKQLDNPMLTDMKKYDQAWIIQRILKRLVENGDARAESLALECSQKSNMVLKHIALHCFVDLKSSRGVQPLLHLLKWGPLKKGYIDSYVTFPPHIIIYEATAMWAITQIGDSALPFLETALKDTNDKFIQRVAVLISRIGTRDSLLRCQAGQVLVRMLEERSDSFYLEKAIRGIAALQYRAGIPAIISILTDPEIRDHPMYLISEGPFLPNRVSIWMLNKFGLTADFRFEKGIGWVYEFEDTCGTLNRVIKAEGDVPIMSVAYDETLKYYEEKITNDPNDLIGWFHLAACHIKLKEYNKAIDIYEDKVLKIDPRNIDAMSYLAYCYRELGDKKKALEWLKKAEEMQK